jgi:hypothetical protein
MLSQALLPFYQCGTASFVSWPVSVIAVTVTALSVTRMSDTVTAADQLAHTQCFDSHFLAQHLHKMCTVLAVKYCALVYELYSIICTVRTGTNCQQ